MPLNRNIPKNSHILWMISLIQDISPEAQTKSEFSQMADEICSTESIDKITLCLADNLQRFRFMLKNGCTEAEAIKICDNLSEKWYLDNAKSLQELKEKKNLVILKWDEFLTWPEYEKTVRAVEDLYIKDNKFKKDVDGRIRQELNRLGDTAKINDATKQTELLKKYLFEESAFQKFVASKNFKFELYKTSFPPPAKRIMNNSDFVPPGFLAEVYFTQFNNTQKNHHSFRTPLQQFNSPLNTPIGIDFPPNFSTMSHNSTPNDFKSVLSQPIKQKEQTTTILSSSPEKKFATFIESTIGLLSDEQKEKAIKALIQFTNEKIIPLSYEKDNRQSIPTFGT